MEGADTGGYVRQQTGSLYRLLQIVCGYGPFCRIGGQGGHRSRLRRSGQLWAACLERSVSVREGGMGAVGRNLGIERRQLVQSAEFLRNPREGCLSILFGEGACEEE